MTTRDPEPRTADEWVPRFFVVSLVAVADPDQSILDYVSPTLAEQPGGLTEAERTARTRLMSVDPLPSRPARALDEVALSQAERRRVDQLVEQPVWKQPQRPRQYPRKAGVRAKRRRFG